VLEPATKGLLPLCEVASREAVRAGGGRDIYSQSLVAGEREGRVEWGSVRRDFGLERSPEVARRGCETALTAMVGVLRAGGVCAEPTGVDVVGAVGAVYWGLSRQRRRERGENVLTWSHQCDTGLLVVEVQADGVRWLRMGNGDRSQVEAFESGVAACRGGRREGSHDLGSHVFVPGLKSECAVLLLRSRLARHSKSLERDSSPALRICMETTRASLLWQAAAVRPEPERMPSLRWCADSGGVVSHVFGVVLVLLF
jgi:hypothetical protein